ncbi:unnamed protein product, partial [marine sediment metagenome]
DMGSNLIIILPGNPEEENYMGAQLAFGTQKSELTIDDLRAIEREATLITEVAPIIISSSVASYSNKSTQSTVVASTEKAAQVRKQAQKYAEELKKNMEETK